MNCQWLCFFIGWSWDIRHERKVDNEEDCGHVIRVGNPGRHCNIDNVRDDLHQDSENAGGDHMADTASLKEILFRHVAEQRKRCESMEVCQVGRRTEIAKLRALESVIQEARLDIEYIRWCKKNGH